MLLTLPILCGSHFVSCSAVHHVVLGSLFLSRFVTCMSGGQTHLRQTSVWQTLGGRACIVLCSWTSTSSRRLLGAMLLSASLSGPLSRTLAIIPLQTLSCCHLSLP